MYKPRIKTDFNIIGCHQIITRLTRLMGKNVVGNNEWILPWISYLFQAHQRWRLVTNGTDNSLWKNSTINFPLKSSCFFNQQYTDRFSFYILTPSPRPYSLIWKYSLPGKNNADHHHWLTVYWRSETTLFFKAPNYFNGRINMVISSKWRNMKSWKKRLPF